MRNVQLVQLDPTIDETLMSDPGYIGAMMAEDWAQVAELVLRQVGQPLRVEPVSVDTLQWGGYCVVDTATREVVGSCAFKGPPSGGGSVELAYFTYAGFEGRGYATAMAAKLIELTGESADVQLVIAHTLPEPSASTRVLEKVGMLRVGEVSDPDDGIVWRWERAVDRSAGGRVAERSSPHTFTPDSLQRAHTISCGPRPGPYV